MKVTVNTSELFKGYATGGLEFADWLTLDDEGQLKQRLSFIASRAGGLTETPYSPDYGIPGNVWADAQLLRDTAHKALIAANEKDFMTASGLAMEAGRMMAEINRLLATYSGLLVKAEMQKPKSAGGKATAEVKREAEQSKLEDTRARWEKLSEQGKPQRERAGIISIQTGDPVDTVRRRIKKAGLR